ncbi:hypothetical protein [Paraburkholderia sp. J8-2]|uniref:hypothetical protein n=1 Tax=Paraburkholderia sp. J8-2 TaxID=2805440 RepID=UPI002AB6021B|nr:hypothetical protein [Paraburkholderia sp. J8-2]
MTTLPSHKLEQRVRRQLDARVGEESRLANELQREKPGITRTEALKAARQMLSKITIQV